MLMLAADFYVEGGKLFVPFGRTLIDKDFTFGCIVNDQPLYDRVVLAPLNCNGGMLTKICFGIIWSRPSIFAGILGQINKNASIFACFDSRMEPQRPMVFAGILG